MMIFNVLAIAYTRTANPGYFSVLFRTGVYNRQLYQNTQEDLRMNSLASVMLTISYFNVFAVLTGAVFPFLKPVFLLIVAFVVMSAVLIKYVLMWLTGFIIDSRAGISEHWVNHLIFFQIAATVITPVLCFSHFLTQSVQQVIFAVLLMFLLMTVLAREFQSFMRAIRLRISVVYIILYLCTLELLPLVVLIREFVS